MTQPSTPHPLQTNLSLSNSPSPPPTSRIDPLSSFFNGTPPPSPSTDHSPPQDPDSDASLFQYLHRLASHGQYQTVLKVAQEQFHLKKTQTHVDVRLCHMMAKLGLHDVEHVRKHLWQLRDVHRDDEWAQTSEKWIMRFMRVWVRDWTRVEREKYPTGANASQRRSGMRNQVVFGDGLFHMLREASEYVHHHLYRLSMVGVLSQQQSHRRFLRTRDFTNKDGLKDDSDPVFVLQRELEKSEDLGLWRQREISIMTMLVTLYTLKEDHMTALRMSRHLLNYCEQLHRAQHEDTSEEWWELAHRIDHIVTLPLLTSLRTIHGRLLIHIGYTQEAQYFFDQIQETDKDSLWVPLNQALIHFSKHEYDAALSILKETYESLLEKKENAPRRQMRTFLCECINSLAVTYFHKNQLEKAIDTLEGYIRRDPKFAADIPTVHNLCRFYELQSEVGSKYKKKTMKKLVRRYRLVEYPDAIFLL